MARVTSFQWRIHERKKNLIGWRNLKTSKRKKFSKNNSTTVKWNSILVQSHNDKHTYAEYSILSLFMQESLSQARTNFFCCWTFSLSYKREEINFKQICMKRKWVKKKIYRTGKFWLNDLIKLFFFFFLHWKLSKKTWQFSWN